MGSTVHPDPGSFQEDEEAPVAENATVYDFTTRRKIEPTAEHPVVEGEVASTTPSLPVSLRPVTPPASGVSKSVLLKAACATVAQAWTDNTPIALHGWSPEANASRRHLLWVLTKFTVLDVPGATLRGGCLAVVAWWHWVHQTQRRREAILDGRYASQAKDIAEKSTARAKQSAIGLAVGAVAVLVFLHRATTEAELWAAAALALVLFCRGYQWKALRRPETTKVGTYLGGDIYGLQRALIAAKLMVEEQVVELRTIVTPRPEGRGVTGAIQLPLGLSVAKVIKNRQALASGLGCDSDFLKLWKEGGDDKLGFWIPGKDPFANSVRKHPLLTVERWNVWKPAPFAFTPRDQEVNLRLVYSSALIGAKPRVGKTWSARAMLVPFVLDPTVPVYVANGKGDGAWGPLKDFSTRYINGVDEDNVMQVDDMLRELEGEMRKRMRENVAESSRIVESDGVAPILVVIDELQVYTSDGEPHPDKLRGSKATYGQWIDHRLTNLAKVGPAAGIIPVLITQRPSDESLSTELRAVLGTRYALRTMDYQTSNMILGNVSKLGVDASTLPAQHKGVGILLPDMEEGMVDESLGAYPVVRTYEVDDDDWVTVCARGWSLRSTEGTLPHQPDVHEGEEVDLDELDERLDAARVPDLLESVFDLVHDLDDDDRVPTRALHEQLVGEEMSETAFGRRLRAWGCPSDPRVRPRGPRVGDIRAAVARIQAGGPVEINPVNLV